VDEVLGETGWNYLNGDGVLFYPGTDTRFPEDNYGVSGPFASLRLKHWRRGIQDVDYLTMAAAANSTRTAQLVDKMIPRVLWEVGVTDPSDPTWVLSDISWSTDPDVWEAARAELADIIETVTPIPDIKANGSDGPVTLHVGETLVVAIDLTARNAAGLPADWWLVKADTNGKLEYFDLGRMGTVSGLAPTYQGNLVSLASVHLPGETATKPGTYTWFFLVDLARNGALDLDSLYYDLVSVTVSGQEQS
jgi:hypothetical protein